MDKAALSEEHKNLNSLIKEIRGISLKLLLSQNRAIFHQITHLDNSHCPFGAASTGKP